MATQNNKVVKALINKKEGTRISSRHYAGFFVVYLLVMVFCVSGFVLNGNVLNASSGESGGGKGLDIRIWVAIGVVTAAFIAFSIYYFVRRKRN